MPDVSKEKLTADEIRRQKAMSEQMGDIEFQMDIAPYFDYKGPIDPAIARYQGIKGLSGDVDLTLGGFYVKPNEAYDEDELAPYKGRADGISFEVPKEIGTINAVHSKATPNMWAHEYGHQLRGSGEEYQRLADAATAQNERDWESSVKMWRDFLLRRGREVTPSEAQEDLIERLNFNLAVTPRKIYEQDYARGARGPMDTRSPGGLKRDSADYEEDRIEKALWKKKEQELLEFEWWKESGMKPGILSAMSAGIIGDSLSERNEKRKSK